MNDYPEHDKSQAIGFYSLMALCLIGAYVSQIAVTAIALIAVNILVAAEVGAAL